MPYTPMMTALNKAKQSKSILVKSQDLPIVFPYPNEDEFFELLSGWAGHHGMELTEESDHYMGFAGVWRFLGGKAVLGSWKDGKAYLYIFFGELKKMIPGEFKEYMSVIKTIKEEFGSLLDLFGVTL